MYGLITWSSACLAISLPVPFVSIEQHALCPRGDKARSPWWAWCVGEGSVKKLSHAGYLHTYCWPLVIQQVGTHIATQPFRSAFPKEAVELKLFLTSGKMELMLQSFFPCSSVTRILSNFMRHFITLEFLSML